MAEKDPGDFWKMKCIEKMTNWYLSNLTPMIEEYILSDDELSSHHITTLNNLKAYFDEERRPLTWDDVCAAVIRKYTEITSINAVERYENFSGLVKKCKEKYQTAMELYVSESTYLEEQLKEKHQSEMENSLHLFRKEASTTDTKWEKHLETFIVGFYNKCLTMNKNRLEVTEDLIAHYRSTMTDLIQQPLTDKELINLHHDGRREIIDQFLHETYVEWLPKPTPDSKILSRKLDSEYETIKSANANKRDKVYSSLVEKWTAEYDKKMKASIEDCILKNFDFNVKHEKHSDAIYAAFDKEAPTDGPCCDNWLQTLHAKLLEKQRELSLQNQMKQKKKMEALIDHHRSQFNTVVRGSLKEQIPNDTDREKTIRSSIETEIEEFIENAPVYAEPLEEWIELLVSEINKVADTVRAEINNRKEERRRTEMYRTALDEALQRINEEMEQEFGPHTAYALPEFIKESAKKLKEYIKGWFVTQITNDEPCPEFILRKIDEHIESTKAKYINHHSERLATPHVDIPMTSDHREKLRELSSMLVENVEMDATLIAHLKSNDVIPQAWTDDLSNQMHSQRERTLTLLKRLEKRPDSAYEGFMRALKHSGQDHLALQLL